MFAEIESLVDLQSLSAAMSVSCSSLSSSCRGAALANKKSRNSAAVGYDGAYEEELYAFLDAKPEVDDRRRGGKKGRRHAADALLSRKLARHAYLIKSIVSGGGGAADAYGGAAAAALAPPTANNNNNNNNNATGTAQIGKKRRVRLLSEHMQDFNVAVPYSLNRKNRWRAADDSATGCLKALAESASATTGGDERVRLSVVESYFHLNRSLGDASQVTAYRELDANGALLLDRAARSTRGAPLKNLLNVAPPRDASSECEEADALKDAAAAAADQLNVQYHFTRPHACAKVMGAHLLRMKGRVKSMRRMCYNVYPLMNGGGGSGEKRAASRAAAADDAADEIRYAQPLAPPPPAAPSEAENREEWIAAMYRQRPRRLFTLADFVVETTPPPVIVRRSKTTASASYDAREDIENQFVITDSAEQIPSAEDDEDMLGEKLSADALDESADAAAAAPVDISQVGAQWAKRHNANFATFKSFSAPARRYAIHSADAWDALCAQILTRRAEDGGANALWTRAWRQNARRFAVDASALFARRLGEAADLPPADESAPLLVLVFEYAEHDETLKVLINGAFKCALDARQLAAKFGGRKDVIGDSTFARLVEEVVDACVWNGLSVGFAPRVDKIPVASCQKRAYHSRRFAVATDASTVAQIVERDALEKENATQNLRTVGGEPFEEIRADEAADSVAAAAVALPDAAAAAASALDDELDDFEHIDMDAEFGFEKVAPKVEESALAASETEAEAADDALAAADACALCGESSASKVLTLAACGHSFCAKCLNAEFVKRARFGELSARCLSENCHRSEVPLEWLQTVVPLPMASQFAVAHHLTRCVSDVQKVLAECPDCGVFLAAANAGEFRHLACGKCGVVFCAQCRRQPHWPLSCKHSELWAQKFDAQFKLNETKRAAAAGGAPENAIAQQFSTICCEARARRIDASTGWQLAKNFARLCAGEKISANEFGEARKAALYILEFGLAWLYMNRSNNNNNSSSDNKADAQIRAQLKSLLKTLYKKVESLDNELLFSGSLSDAQRVAAKADEMRALAESAIAKLKSAH